MPERIEISYSAKPRGQVGTRPRKVALNDTFRFMTADPGVLTIEFIGDSPLADGARTAPANKDLRAAKAGRYKFKCVLERSGTKVTLGDPNDPASEAGGEIDVGP